MKPCKECLEQARLLGMGSEREARLMAKLAIATKALEGIKAQQTIGRIDEIASKALAEIKE